MGVYKECVGVTWVADPAPGWSARCPVPCGHSPKCPCQ